MIELRWVVNGSVKKLQYRQKIEVTDYSTENYITVKQWSKWMDVPEVYNES